MIGVDAVHPLGSRAVILRRSQSVHHVNALDHKYAVIAIHDFACDLGCQFPILSVDFAHIQCAAQSAHQSTTDSRHQVVNGRGMRFHDVSRVNTIMGGDCSVNAERYGIRFAGKARITQRTFAPFDLHFGDVSYFNHFASAGWYVLRV